jgi:hypothetical protein
MKYLILSSCFLITSILFTSCEQPLDEDEFPYEMKIVVRGIIEPDRIIDEIYIGRTLPVAVPFDEDFAKLKDAVGAVVSDGIFYPLRHTGNGIYTTDSLTAQVGKTYSLLVYYQDKSVSAETYIPVHGSIVSYKIINTQEEGEFINIMEGTIIPRGNESYTASWVFVNFNGVVGRESENFVQVVSSSPGQQVKVKTEKIPPNLINSTSGSLGIRVYVYDKAFYDFYQTQGSAQITDAIFGQPGTNIRWNVEGDGIGLFVGRTDTVYVQ